MTALNDFLEAWGDESPEVKAITRALTGALQDLPGLVMSYQARPGISHSLRLGADGDADRPFYALIDVIDDEPEARWLSVCLYADLAEDPEHLAGPIPGGLNGQDAVCFDLDEEGEELVPYLVQVLKTAHSKATV